jgi:hypothetical protein
MTISSNAYHGFKCLLAENLSDESLFVLFAHLVEHCPFKPMTSLLVDIVKAFLQLTVSLFVSVSASSASGLTDKTYAAIAWNKVSPTLASSSKAEQEEKSIRVAFQEALKESDVIQLCNRIIGVNADHIDALVLSNPRENHCYSSVFYSPYLIKRFALMPLVKFWKQLNEELTLSKVSSLMIWKDL